MVAPAGTVSVVGLVTGEVTETNAPPEGAAAELIHETDAGIVAPPDDVEALAAALRTLHDAWAAGTLDGTRLSPVDRERLGRAARVEELAELLRSLAV